MGVRIWQVMVRLKGVYRAARRWGDVVVAQAEHTPMYSHLQAAHVLPFYILPFNVLPCSCTLSFPSCVIPPSGVGAPI